MILRSAFAALIVMSVFGCDSDPAIEPPVEVSFRAFEGHYVAPLPGAPTNPIGTAMGEFVFRTQAEWEAAAIDTREGDVALVDSVVVAYAYRDYNACASGGAVERVTREGTHVTITLAPVVTPVPYCLADRPFQALAVIARADLPAGTDVVFEVPEGVEVRAEGAP